MTTFAIVFLIIIVCGLSVWIKLEREKAVSLNRRLLRAEFEASTYSGLANAYEQAISNMKSAPLPPLPQPPPLQFSTKTEGLIALALNQKNSEEGRNAAVQAIKRISKERNKV